MLKFYQKKRGGDDMAKVLTTKKPKTVNSRSKALNATKTRQKPNKQKKTIK